MGSGSSISSSRYRPPQRSTPARTSRHKVGGERPQSTKRPNQTIEPGIPERHKPRPAPTPKNITGLKCQGTDWREKTSESILDRSRAYMIECPYDGTVHLILKPPKMKTENHSLMDCPETKLMIFKTT